MTTYLVYFELYGKKMRVTIRTKSPEQAEEILRGKIVIHRIEEDPHDEFKEAVGLLKKMSNLVNSWGK